MSRDRARARLQGSSQLPTIGLSSCIPLASHCHASHIRPSPLSPYHLFLQKELQDQHRLYITSGPLENDEQATLGPCADQWELIYLHLFASDQITQMTILLFSSQTSLDGIYTSFQTWLTTFLLRSLSDCSPIPNHSCNSHLTHSRHHIINFLNLSTTPNMAVRRHVPSSPNLLRCLSSWCGLNIHLCVGSLCLFTLSLSSTGTVHSRVLGRLFRFGTLAFGLCLGSLDSVSVCFGAVSSDDGRPLDHAISRLSLCS